jgi:hypothetical protein
MKKRIRSVVGEPNQVADDGQGLVWHCGDLGHLLSFTCPLEWAKLQVTDNPEIRYCNQCQKNVNFCSSPEMFVNFSKKGECVALPLSVQVPRDRAPGGLGMPRPWAYDLDQTAKAWWAQVEESGIEGRTIYTDMIYLQQTVAARQALGQDPMSLLDGCAD